MANAYSDGSEAAIAGAEKPRKKTLTEQIRVSVDTKTNKKYKTPNQKRREKAKAEKIKNVQSGPDELREAAFGTDKADDLSGSAIITAGGDPVAGAATVTPANRSPTVGTVVRVTEDTNQAVADHTGSKDPNLPTAEKVQEVFADAGMSLQDDLNLSWYTPPEDPKQGGIPWQYLAIAGAAIIAILWSR